MATRAGVQNILEPSSASVMPKTSFVEKINLFLLLFPSATMVKLSFTKTWYYGEKHSRDCAAADARKIAVHSTLVQWVDGKTATLHKAFYPVLKVDFRNNQALWPCSQAKLAAFHPSGTF